MSEISTPASERGVPGVNAPEAATFEEFWPYYLSQHMEPTTRALHVTGTSVALILLVSALLGRRPRRLLLAPMVGYGFAWGAHFFVEGNKPATFGAAKWSLRADLRLLVRTFRGTIERDMAAVRQALTEPGEAGQGAERAA